MVDNLETTNGGQGGNETRTLSSFAQKHKGFFASPACHFINNKRGCEKPALVV